MEKNTEAFLKRMPRSILVKGYIAVCICLIMAAVVLSVIPKKNKLSFTGELGVSGTPEECLITLDRMPEGIGDIKDISSLELTVPLAGSQSDRLFMAIPNSGFSVSLASDSGHVYLYGTRSRILASWRSQGIVTGKVRGSFYINGRSIIVSIN